MSLTDKQEVMDLLEEMRSGLGGAPCYGAFKSLLSRLNYQRANARVPLNTAMPEIADPPTLVATGGQDSAFHVIYTKMAGQQLSRVPQRALVSELLRTHPYALFVFSNEQQNSWHFLNVKAALKQPADDENPKLRRLFRRISVGPEDRLRTAMERIELLDLEKFQGELSSIPPLAIQEAHDTAFDVEAVTKQFFQKYKEVFEYVEEEITGIRGPDKRRLFTQRLFNRLMFIAFIQKKRWLKFPAMKEYEYLGALWRDYQAKRKDDSNFYANRLYHLFFKGLNNAANIDMLATNRGGSAPDSFLQRVIGDVPYLNGGLFEKSDDGSDDDTAIVIPDKAIDAILGREDSLFRRFNFTVTESTPLDVEVAVDPEMLGKVFEELVTGRHESGSYYTPKPIVSFMCREALKGYLESKCPREKPEALGRFVDEHEATSIADGEAVLEALRTVK
jgi:hypothetical protein